MVRLSRVSKISAAKIGHLPQVLTCKFRSVWEAVVAHGPSKSFLKQRKQPLRSHNSGSLKFPPLLECLAELPMSNDVECVARNMWLIIRSKLQAEPALHITQQTNGAEPAEITPCSIADGCPDLKMGICELTKCSDYTTA
jgi:hypothetical protein